MSQRDRCVGAHLADNLPEAAIDPLRQQHLSVTRRDIQIGTGRAIVMVDDGESPLTWLARRKGRDGAALINAVQLAAGERLRADFTRAQLMPRTTSNWGAAVASGRRRAGGGKAVMSDMIVAARQRVRHALDAVGPEFAGVLLDVCCFLKGLEDVERERRWPSRSAKVVLQLGLDCLARHYGYRQEIRGTARAAIRAWNADAALSNTEGE
ncbi:MAG: DNA replication protein [Rhizobiales bacterium]|nr:DNA replication protein [Hyphomicrobiales bacterium]